MTCKHISVLKKQTNQKPSKEPKEHSYIRSGVERGISIPSEAFLAKEEKEEKYNSGEK